MYRDNGQYRGFSRRVAILAGGQMALFGLLGARLYQLQVLESEKYTLLAEDNRINVRLLAPPRGWILDRTGQPLAINRENYRMLLVAEQAQDVDRTLDILSEMTTVTDADRQRIYRELKRIRRFVPVTVRENLNWSDVSRIEVNAPDLPGVRIEVGQTREYPFGIDAANVLGYVAAAAERDLDGDPLLELPGFRIGKTGVERFHETGLRGKAGNSQVEVNAVGRPIREIYREEGTPGADVTLTLDIELQRVAMERLKAEESAAAVVIDVHNGDILVLASWPSYDPNAFSQGLSATMWRELTRDPRGPLTNKAIAGQYAPGSTFKMVVALAALEAGAVTPATRITCSGYTELGNARFHCWKKHGHGPMDMISGLAQSCDVYFYELARRVGVDRIQAMSLKLGLGRTLGLDIPGEKPGLIPTRAWKRATFGENWQQGETLVAGIGQGYITTTPLQLATMTARLVNGGRAVVPHLTLSDASGESARVHRAGEAPALGIPPSALRVVLEGMNQVTNSRSGTAYGARIAEVGKEMGGKTGTSQVRRITKAERATRVLKNEELPWEERDHALFVGYAPVHAPQYAVAVIVEHGGGGSKVAAPIARDILIETQRRDPSRRDRAPRGDDRIAAVNETERR
ncbi:MAG: penicillin-binding protein 2 [Alphaproteobacteria bacterium]|nr:penicillin-binding protein 2 [Alphaproteobacteria bacterium]